jgi:hypothetical protein
LLIDADRESHRVHTGLTPEKIRNDLESHKVQLMALGIEVNIYLFDIGSLFLESAATFVEDLRTVGYDVVEIGAGMRKTTQYIYEFEQTVNLVHLNAPTTKMCFNLQPDDTMTAILRWL